MKINNWLEAQQIIFFGKQSIEAILMEYVGPRGNMLSAATRWHLLEFGKDHDNKPISEYIPDNRNDLFEQVMTDIEEAKQFLQELNK